MNTVDVADTVEMICVAYGNPVPTVTWFWPGCFDLNDTLEATSVQIYSEIVTLGNTTFQKSMMQICAIKPEDSDRYTCTAKEWCSRYRAGKPSSYLPSDSQWYARMLDQHYFVGCYNEILLYLCHEGGESSPSPTPTNTIINTIAILIMIIEGVITLILFLALLTVMFWACKVKETCQLPWSVDPNHKWGSFSMF